MEDRVESILNRDWPQKQKKEIPNANAKAKKKKMKKQTKLSGAEMSLFKKNHR